MSIGQNLRRMCSSSSRLWKQCFRSTNRPTDSRKLRLEALEDRCVPAISIVGGITDPGRVVAQSPLPLQPVGVPFRDPAFGTTIRRVSDASERGGFETHIYSQNQAFSSDNAYLLLTGSNGYVVRRVSDLGLVTGLVTSEWNAVRWHPTRAHTLVHYDTNANNTVTVQFTDLDTRTTTNVFTFPPEYVRIVNSPSSEDLSQDGRWMAGLVQRNDGQRVIFSVDLENRRLGAVMPLRTVYTTRAQPDPTYGDIEPDWVGVSPLGNYLVVGWKRDGTAGASGVETLNILTGAFVGRVNDGHQHGDLGVMPDGRTEYYMTFEVYGSPADRNRPAIGLRLFPGTATASEPIALRSIDWGNADHISARGPNGVSLITSGADPSNGYTAFEGELWLQNTDGSVQRIAHHRSSRVDYWVQPRASISHDGRYVVFASDWGRQTGGRGDPYIIDLMPGTTGNNAPILSAITDRSVTAGQTLTLAVQARDPDNHAITFSLAPGAPASASIDPRTGVLTWSPTTADAGRSFSITVQVTDNGTPALSASTTFRVAVTNTTSTPTEVTLAAVADTYVDGRFGVDVNANYGDSPVLPFYQDWSGGELRPMLRFDLASVPVGAALVRARLMLYHLGSDYGNDAQSATIRALTRDWTEGGATWASARQGTAWTTQGGDLSGGVSVTIPAFTQAGQVGFDVTALVRQWLSGELGNHGLMFDLAPGANSVQEFASREDSDAAHRPVLVLEFEGETTSNRAPVLATIANQTVTVGQTIRVSASATDPDGNRLSYSLAPGAPATARMDPDTGLFTWTPAAGDAGRTIAATILVTDNGTPALTASRTFSITVEPTVEPLVLDMNSRPGGNDGRADLLRVERIADNVVISRNGVVVLQRGIATVSSVEIIGSQDTDEILVQGLAGIAVSVDGRGGVDRLVGPNQDNLWRISATNAGSLGSVLFVGIETLLGGSGADVFRLSDNTGVSGSIDGRGGSDTLDYSDYAAIRPVAVNLTTLRATRVAGSIVGFENVVGGQGNDSLIGNGLNNLLRGEGGNDTLIGLTGHDILLGGDGADSLDGRAGRDLLIGGTGADRLIGGTGEDIVVGGSTAFDANATALQAVLAEWTSARTYGQRILNLTGANNTTFGLRRNGTFFLLPDSGPRNAGSAATVVDDAFLDLLSGGDPVLGDSERDWFFRGLTDRITDLNRPLAEQVY